MGRLIVVSNRVALPTRQGGAQAGGLAVAMRAVLRRQSGIWFGWSGSVAQDAPGPAREVSHGGLTYIVTDLVQEDYDEYYNGFANRVLWPILHYRLDLAEFRAAISPATCGSTSISPVNCTRSSSPTI